LEPLVDRDAIWTGHSSLLQAERMFADLQPKNRTLCTQYRFPGRVDSCSRNYCRQRHERRGHGL
jgi:hypothetical protein